MTALVGATGGAGTTRTAVEFAAALARDGRTVSVVDAAFATQGLAEYVDDRIRTDLTTLTLDPDRPLANATYELVGSDAFPNASDSRTDEPRDERPSNGGTTQESGDDSPSDDGTEPTGETEPGRAVAVPVAAAFERLARAKTADASQELESRIATAADRFDHVLLDVPPIGANPHVAAATTADRRVCVTPATDHGADARRRLVDRLADLDRSLDATVGVGGPMPAADATIPEGPTAVADAPSVVTGDGTFTRAVFDAVEVACDTETSVALADGTLDRLRETIR